MWPFAFLKIGIFVDIIWYKDPDHFVYTVVNHSNKTRYGYSNHFTGKTELVLELLGVDMVVCGSNLRARSFYSTPSSAAVRKVGCLFRIKAEFPRPRRMESLCDRCLVFSLWSPSVYLAWLDGWFMTNPNREKPQTKPCHTKNSGIPWSNHAMLLL